MTATHFRFCFDPVLNRRFKNADQFEDWCAKNLTSLDYTCAGYIILDWNHVPSRSVGPHWNVLVPAKKSFGPGETDALGWLAARNWQVDGITVIPYVRYSDVGEKLFPIHQTVTNT